MTSMSTRPVQDYLLRSQFDRITVTIVGTSMEPTLHEGDRALVRRGTILPGRIVAFAQGDAVVVHRVVGWWPYEGCWCLLTKGDNRRAFDNPVPPEKVIGRVDSWIRGSSTFRESRIRRAGRWLASVGGYLAARLSR